MELLSPEMILDVWERGSGMHLLDIGLLVLDRCCPEHTRENLLDLSIGNRDRLLVEAYRMSFGDLLEAYTECGSCRERLEFSLSCSQFLDDGSVQAIPSDTIDIDGIHFSLRPPTNRDAALAAAGESVEAAKRILLSRCATPVSGFEGSLDTLPETAQEAIAARIAALDPQAEVITSLVCPVCGETWQGVFEIIHFLWAEIRVRARRLLQEIDALARVYGWREVDILAMSETRRSTYVQMALS